MYEIELSKKAARYYTEIDDKTARMINRCFGIISKNPYYHPNIKKLHGEFKGSYRYRLGDLRIIYSIDETQKTLFVELIAQRGQAYR